MGEPNMICARDIGGAKICTQVCDPDVNSCPWGFASTCNVFDEERGVPTCAHRFGSCVGTGAGCEPCVTHGDCPGGQCYVAPHTGERFCIDLSVECSCTQTDARGQCLGGGCPASPSGVGMLCFGGSEYATSLYHQKCIGAFINPDPIFQTAPLRGCWPMN
jgi:hypothetical protein